jgi:hypothetical protein
MKLTKQILIDKGFRYIDRKGPSGADQWQGVDFWKLPYANNTKELILAGYPEHLVSLEDNNIVISTVQEIEDYVFNKIKKVI